MENQVCHIYLDILSRPTCWTNKLSSSLAKSKPEDYLYQMLSFPKKKCIILGCQKDDIMCNIAKTQYVARRWKTYSTALTIY
jgi:hypothetical protein